MFSKKCFKLMSYSMLFSLGYTFINPIVATAAEITGNNYNEVLLEGRFDTKISGLEKTFLKDLIIFDETTNDIDYDYLSNLCFVNNNGTLIVVSENQSDTYEIHADIHTAHHETIKINDVNMTGVSFQIKPESKIELIFENKDTKKQYQLLISLKSNVLNNLSDDLDIKLSSITSQEPKIEELEDESEVEETEEVKDESEVEETEEVKDESEVEETEEVKDESEVEETEEVKDESEVEETEEVKDESEVEETEEVKDAPEVEETEEVKDAPEAEESEEVKVEESPEIIIEKAVPMLSIFSLAKASNMVAKNGLYTVVAGDTLNNIAKNFNVSLPQLKVYNNIPSSSNFISTGQVLAVSREGVESLLPSSEKAHLYQGGTNIFNGAKDFFNYIAPTAMQIANAVGEKKLYASVMIAQAAHETGFGTSGLSAVPYHNLSGIKGTYNGEYVKMWTGEYIKNYNNTGEDVYVYVLADFKKFPSYEVSLQSYANLLRYGTSWNKNLYSGTWFENTNSYLDATAELTKNYATDPAYAMAVNNMIKKYDLTKYDNNDVFLTKKVVDFYGTVLPGNKGIYTKPYGMSDSILYTSYKHNNKNVHITEEATTQSGTFLKLVDIDTRATLGWIRKVDVGLYDTFITKQKVNYYATVDSNNNGIYTKPKGMYDSILYTSYKYNDKKVHITEEATTQTGTYAKLVDIDTRATLGWLKKSDLAFYDSFLTKYSVNYTATVLPNNDGIYTKPLGMQGAVLYTSYKYNNKVVKVGEKATTQSGTFLKLVDINTRATLGWIKDKDVN